MVGIAVGPNVATAVPERLTDSAHHIEPLFWVLKGSQRVNPVGALSSRVTGPASPIFRLPGRETVENRCYFTLAMSFMARAWLGRSRKSRLRYCLALAPSPNSCDASAR